MKIGILSQYYTPEIGAPQARLSELVQRLVERGHEVYVLTAMPNYPAGRIHSGYGGMFRREKRAGARIIRSAIFPTKRIGLLPRLANYFSFVLSSILVGSIALPRLDFLLTESPPLFLGLSGYVLSRLKRARWIFNVSDLWPESAVRLGVIRQGLLLRIAEALEAVCYRNAWLVSGQSMEILQSIAERFPQTLRYHLSNGVDTTRFTPESRSDECRRELSGNGLSTCIALYAGLHGIAQGLQQILDAAAQLQDQEKFRVVLVGEGPEKAALIQKSREMGLRNVRFLDPCPREAMPRLLSSADIALVPLKNHLPGAVPSKLYEAMASGLPVVMAAEGEATAILGQAKAGIVVSPGDSSGLASALRELLGDRIRRAELGANGRATAIARFDRASINDKFVDYLEQHTA